MHNKRLLISLFSLVMMSVACNDYAIESITNQTGTNTPLGLGGVPDTADGPCFGWDAYVTDTEDEVIDQGITNPIPRTIIPGEQTKLYKSICVLRNNVTRIKNGSKIRFLLADPGYIPSANQTPFDTYDLLLKYKNASGTTTEISIEPILVSQNFSTSGFDSYYDGVDSDPSDDIDISVRAGVIEFLLPELVFEDPLSATEMRELQFEIFSTVTKPLVSQNNADPMLATAPPQGSIIEGMGFRISVDNGNQDLRSVRTELDGTLTENTMVEWPMETMADDMFYTNEARQKLRNFCGELFRIMKNRITFSYVPIAPVITPSPTKKITLLNLVISAEKAVSTSPDSALVSMYVRIAFPSSTGRILINTSNNNNGNNFIAGSDDMELFLNGVAQPYHVNTSTSPFDISKINLTFFSGQPGNYCLNYCYLTIHMPKEVAIKNNSTGQAKLALEIRARVTEPKEGIAHSLIYTNEPVFELSSEALNRVQNQGGPTLTDNNSAKIVFTVDGVTKPAYMIMTNKTNPNHKDLFQCIGGNPHNGIPCTPTLDTSTNDFFTVTTPRIPLGMQPIEFKKPVGI